MKKFFSKTKNALYQAKEKVLTFIAFLFVSVKMAAQDVTTGVRAINSVSTQLENYIEPIQNLLYAIAGIVALVGVVSVYIKMNNEEQDIKKSIMLVIGACIFLIAAAEALPMFFGL